MKLLSIQEVIPYHFTLYFLAYTEDNPPEKEDLKHVNNREWCWQQKYTMLELQWRWDYATSGQKLLQNGSVLGQKNAVESTGLDCIEIEVGTENEPNSSNLIQTVKANKNFCHIESKRSNVCSDEDSTQLHGIITDPDGLKIKIISKSFEK